MALTFAEAQEKILALLKASDIPSVFDGPVPPGHHLPRVGLAHLPYACVSFGGMSPVAQRSQGITTSRDDLKWTALSVECIGESPRDVRKVTAIVRDLLEGYSPDETWGELSETLAGDYSVRAPDSDLWPVRHATGIFFNTYANA